MALLTVYDVSGYAGGLVTTAAATGGGDTMAGGPGRHLYVNNGGGSSITVTITVQETVRGLAVTNQAVTVTNGTFKIIPIPSFYNNSSSGVASIAYSAVTSVTVAALQCNVSA